MRSGDRSAAVWLIVFAMSKTLLARVVIALGTVVPSAPILHKITKIKVRAARKLAFCQIIDRNFHEKITLFSQFREIHVLYAPLV